MAENKEIQPQYDLNAKWDACLDLGVRRFVYSSAAGAFSGLLFFRSPVTRWASIAFGAGVGIGSAYSECSQKFDGSSQTSPNVVETPVAKVKILPTDIYLYSFPPNIFHHLPRFTHFRETRDEVNFRHFHGFNSLNLQVSSQISIHNLRSKPSIPLTVQKICNLSVNRRRRCSIRRDTCRRRRLCCSQVRIESGTDEEACELVNGVEVLIGEGSDTVTAYLLTAVKNNNGTGILLLSDIFGFEDSSTRDFAYRIACNGYNVLLPDLFNGDPWQKERSMTLFEPWLATHTQTARTNIAASIKWMVDEFLAAGISNKLGIVGFCFGGGKVIDVLSEDSDDRFGIGVSFYGTRIQSSVAAKIKVPVLYITGDDDPLCPVKVVEDIERDNVGGSKVVVFKGRGHGFVHRPASSEEDKDAEEAFMIMRNWLQNGLVAEMK